MEWKNPQQLYPISNIALQSVVSNSILCYDIHTTAFKVFDSILRYDIHTKAFKVFNSILRYDIHTKEFKVFNFNQDCNFLITVCVG